MRITDILTPITGFGLSADILPSRCLPRLLNLLPEFFGLMFGLGGLGSAFFGWLADRTSIEFIFQISTLLLLQGIITGFLPNIEVRKRN